MSVETEVIIPIHAGDRPIRRAVESVLTHTTTSVRIIVVAHNLPARRVKEQLEDYRHDQRVAVWEFSDGIASPAGPKNFALERLSGKYFCFLDSDDTFEPGAIDAWIQVAHSFADPTVVVAPMRSVFGDIKPVPPIRIGKKGILDPVSDRFAYRSAPMGLIPTASFRSLRFREGRATGEDQEFAMKVWFSGLRLAFPYSAPGYVEHSDARERVTSSVRSVFDELVDVDSLVSAATESFSQTQSPLLVRRVRCVIAVQYLRTHFINAVRRRLPEMSPTDRRALVEIAQRVIRLDRQVFGMLSRDEAALIGALGNPEKTSADMAYHARRVAKLRLFGALLPHDMRYLFHEHGPLRFHVARRWLLRAGKRKQ